MLPVKLAFIDLETFEGSLDDPDSCPNKVPVSLTEPPSCSSTPPWGGAPSPWSSTHSPSTWMGRAG